MTLDEAIRHCEDVAEDRCGCAEDCVEEHRQLAEWLKELKERRALEELRTDCDKVLRLSADVLLDKDAREQFLRECKECRITGIYPQTDCPWE